MEIKYKIELAPVSFIAGDYQEFMYNLVNEDTLAPVDIGAARELGMILFAYGDNEHPSIVKQGEPVTINGVASAFLVKLTSDDTKNLNRGLYMQQPYLIDDDGKVFRPGQGKVEILSRGFEENVIKI